MVKIKTIKPGYKWIPTDIFEPVWKIYHNGSYNSKIYVEKISGVKLDANGNCGTFTLTIPNLKNALTKTFSKHDLIEIYADYGTATTKLLKGYIDEIKFYSTGNNGHFISISGRTKGKFLIGKKINISYTKKTLKEILGGWSTGSNSQDENGIWGPNSKKDKTGQGLLYGLGVTINNVEDISDVIKFIQFSDVSINSALNELRQILVCDYYIDTNDDLHFFTQNSIANANFAAIHGQNLIKVNNNKTHSLKYKNKIRVYGGKKSGFQLIYTKKNIDEIEKSNIKEQTEIIADKNITNENQLQDRVSYEYKNKNQETTEISVTTIGYPNVYPGQVIKVSSPYDNIVAGDYRIFSITHNYSIINGWTMDIELTNSNFLWLKQFNLMDKKYNEIKEIKNIEDFDFSTVYTFFNTDDFDSYNNINTDGIEGTAFIQNISDGEGDFILKRYTAPYNINNIEVRVKKNYFLTGSDKVYIRELDTDEWHELDFNYDSTDDYEYGEYVYSSESKTFQLKFTLNQFDALFVANNSDGKISFLNIGSLIEMNNFDFNGSNVVGGFLGSDKHLYYITHSGIEYEVNKTTGIQINSQTCPVYVSGICLEPNSTDRWIIDAENHRISLYSSDYSELKYFWPLPSNSFIGLHVDENHIWTLDSLNNKLYKFDKKINWTAANAPATVAYQNAVISNYVVDTAYANAIGYDNSRDLFWIINKPSREHICAVDPDTFEIKPEYIFNIGPTFTDNEDNDLYSPRGIAIDNSGKIAVEINEDTSSGECESGLIGYVLLTLGSESKTFTTSWQRYQKELTTFDDYVYMEQLNNRSKYARAAITAQRYDSGDGTWKTLNWSGLLERDCSYINDGSKYAYTYAIDYGAIDYDWCSLDYEYPQAFLTFPPLQCKITLNVITSRSEVDVIDDDYRNDIALPFTYNYNGDFFCWSAGDYDRDRCYYNFYGTEEYIEGTSSEYASFGGYRGPMAYGAGYLIFTDITNSKSKITTSATNTVAIIDNDGKHISCYDRARNRWIAADENDYYYFEGTDFPQRVSWDLPNNMEPKGLYYYNDTIYVATSNTYLVSNGSTLFDSTTNCSQSLSTDIYYDTKSSIKASFTSDNGTIIKNFINDLSLYNNVTVYLRNSDISKSLKIITNQGEKEISNLFTAEDTWTKITVNLSDIITDPSSISYIGFKGESGLIIYIDNMKIATKNPQINIYSFDENTDTFTLKNTIPDKDTKGFSAISNYDSAKINAVGVFWK